jgi:predicted dehydrogenase
MALSDGSVATLDASWSRPSLFPTWGDVTMEIVASGGVLSLDLFAQTHSVHRMRRGEAGTDTQWVNWGDDMDRGLIADFVDAVRDGRAPAVSGEDGLAALEVTVAAYRSIERREAITLPLAE